jgi:hypothetical protein
MEDARSVLMMALIIIASAMGDDVSVKSTQGLVLFQKKGTLISETEHSIIVFHVDCAQVLDAVQKFKELISKVGDNEHHQLGNDMVLDVTNVQGNLGSMGALLEVEDGQREKKGGITLRPLSFRPRSFRPGHFVPLYISSPVISSPVISSP